MPSTTPSIDEMADDVIDNWLPKVSDYERQMFIQSEETDLVQFHHGLGTDIRNTYDLWSIIWEPQIVEGIDMSADHPDAVSMAVITTVWKRLQ
jgi:hypothetical protein